VKDPIYYCEDLDEGRHVTGNFVGLSAMATTTPTGVPRAFAGGNAERYLMEADALRRRQLSAFLHGTARGWRYRRRLWVAALAGVVVVAAIAAVIGVAHAFAWQTEINQKEQRRAAVGSVFR
jgi:hypothetical protein